MISGIYKIVNKVNGKIYIGKSVNIEKRLVTHFERLRKNKHHNEHLQSAWSKYGDGNFGTEILYVVDRKFLDVAEMCAIYTLDSDKESFGYNLTTGGEGVDYFLLSKASRLKRDKAISLALKGRKLSEEHKNNMFHQGNKGKRHSEETKRKISEKKKGTKSWAKGLKKDADPRVKKWADAPCATRFQKGFIPWNKI